MILHAYAIFDSAIGAYNSPFFMQTDGMAIRAFSDNVNSPDSALSKHPDQFILYRLGDYDDQTGMFTQDQAPKSLGNGAQFFNPKDATELEKLAEAVARIEAKLREALH